MPFYVRYRERDLDYPGVWWWEVWHRPTDTLVCGFDTEEKADAFAEQANDDYYEWAIRGD